MTWWMYALMGLGYVLTGDTIARIKLKVLKLEITNPVIRYLCFPATILGVDGAVPLDKRHPMHFANSAVNFSFDSLDFFMSSFDWVCFHLASPRFQDMKGVALGQARTFDADSVRKYVMLSWIHWPLHVIWLMIVSVLAMPKTLGRGALLTMKGTYRLIGKGFNGAYNLLDLVWEKKSSKTLPVIEEYTGAETRVRVEYEETQEKLAQLRVELEEIERKKTFRT